MKKIISLAAALVISVSAFAQFQVGAGYLNQQFVTKDVGTSNANGFYAGVSYNIPLSFLDGLGFAPGVYYGFGAFKDVDSKLHSINIPVLATFTWDLGVGNLFFDLGPEFAIGLGDWYGDDSVYKPFDLKLALGAGFTYKFIQLNFGYDWGMLNICNVGVGTIHNNYIHAGLAFVF